MAIQAISSFCKDTGTADGLDDGDALASGTGDSDGLDDGDALGVVVDILELDGTPGMEGDDVGATLV